MQAFRVAIWAFCFGLGLTALAVTSKLLLERPG
jgi:tellurite resistance protein TehA-like permease